jgi:hypothetical protein
MKRPALAWLFCIFAWQSLCVSLRASAADINFEPRLAKLEAEREALKEDMKSATVEIEELRTSLKEARDKANSAQRTPLKRMTTSRNQVDWPWRQGCGRLPDRSSSSLNG